MTPRQIKFLATFLTALGYLVLVAIQDRGEREAFCKEAGYAEELCLSLGR